MLGISFVRKSVLALLVELGLHYYTYLRPHRRLGGATPAEIYSGQEPAHLAAVEDILNLVEIGE